MKSDIQPFLLQRASLYKTIAGNRTFKEQIINASGLMKKTIDFGGKILIFGNGGSAAQAQHFATELVCRFEKDRQAIAAIALTTDSSILTAQSNDEGFETVFSRQIEALCRHGDLVIGLTTSDSDISGHSYNILNAFSAAKKMGAKSIGLFSQKTKNLLPLADALIVVPADNTALIQEIHQTLIHLLCHLTEENL